MKEIINSGYILVSVLRIVAIHQEVKSIVCSSKLTDIMCKISCQQEDNNQLPSQPCPTGPLLHRDSHLSLEAFSSSTASLNEVPQKCSGQTQDASGLASARWTLSWEGSAKPTMKRRQQWELCQSLFSEEFHRWCPTS